MSETTEISYGHHTASPWYGCTEVSPGCANCYARRWGLKMGIEWGKGKPRMRSKSFEANVRKWNKQAGCQEGCGDCDPCIGGRPDQCAITPIRRPRIFPSLCDWLDPEVPIEWLADFLRAIHETPNLDWLLLTKRPELWQERVMAALVSKTDGTGKDGLSWQMVCDWLGGKAPANVWLGVTCENQAMADKRIPMLLSIPAKVRWVSAEPLLERIDFGAVPGGLVSPIYQGRRFKIDLVIVGGESGNNRRDCGVDAIVDVVRQCRDAGVPVWVKQDCAFKPGQQGRIPEEIWNLKQLPRL